ncbi:substrate-binding domain-containing protein [Nonomuraea sp. SMC257]|uniref:Substrate-binding domain-containing protein n=1 Tax=Nonomuraea montanisoli TaxID=2741721 RepID=A0A7Y6M6T2_9ACTN|nr:substrate-binding domain-containing protein [Nonomuraea montanisoli]
MADACPVFANGCRPHVRHLLGPAHRRVSYSSRHQTLAGVRILAVAQQLGCRRSRRIVGGCIARPALTTIRQPMVRTGRAAVDILISRLERRRESRSCLQLPERLVVRESCGCSLV